MYYRIRKYNKIFPDFPLYFSWCKHERGWDVIYPMYYEDIFQIISLGILEGKTDKERNRIIKRELYYFLNHILHGAPLNHEEKKKKYNKNKRKKYKWKPTKKHHCDSCNRDVVNYMYKTAIPGLTICSACYKKLRRESNPEWGRNAYG